MLYSQCSVLLGDITTLKVDAIVNAANNSLLGGGGVDGAIHRAGGATILEECKAIIRKQGGCKTGEAVITTGGNLPCKYVIHAVGPVWKGGNQQEKELLSNTYSNSLRLAENNAIQTIAFPNISTGVYGFPKLLAAQTAIAAVAAFLADSGNIQKLVFVCFDNENYNIYRELLQV